MLDFRLDGRVAIVSGAAGGLGQAIGDGLLQLGARVYGTSRDPGVAASIGERYGTEPLVVDVTRPDTISTMLDQVLRDTSKIDFLVNNAGVNIPKLALKTTEEGWDAVFDTNVKGSFLLSQRLAQYWVESGISGSIVNIASQAGIVAIEERAAYGASKAALIHLTKCLALEWAKHSIRVNSVAPTFIRTALTSSTLSRPDFERELLLRIPAGRFGTPEDVVGAVVYLLGGQASLVTGHNLVIDGGYTIR